MNKNRLAIHVAGKELVFETGKIARQANGSVILTCGDTVILATACANKTASPDIDFFPLRVDYQEKFSAAGKTLGGFIKRDGKQTEKDTLTSRLIDRPLRPLFPEGFFNEVQVLCYVLSYDPNCQPDALALCAASAALTISDIPFPKPVGGVRVGRVNGKFVINPTLEEMGKSTLDLLIAGTEEAILMIEGYCDFLTEEEVLEAIEEGHKAIRQICQGLSDWRNIAGKDKFVAPLLLPPEELLTSIENMMKDKFEKVFFISDKQAREAEFARLDAEIYDHFEPETGEATYSPKLVKRALKMISSKLMRHHIIMTKKRADGRALTDIRNISIEQSILPRTHGSSLFTRGETQAIAVCTLGGSSMGQRYEDLDNKDGLRKFYLQYSFPPFSVGEVGAMRGPGRREIGHGKLAEKSLQAILPTEADNFPYTIRLEANITESNGSSSMASVCGGCLALMDAGVPIKRPISGIAMGLLLEESKFAILSDILGMEDALGDMDFKITGDGKGITAFQMDIKVEGITLEIMKAALHQAKDGRIHILEKMLHACPKTSAELSQFAPRIESITVKPSKIATIIGPGGKMIRSIIEESGAEIDINDAGVVNIAATSRESLDKAKALIINLISEAEVGKTYKGAIKSIQPFGVFVGLPGGKDGLCHISEFSHDRIQNMEDHAKEGDVIEVKVLEINDRGQVKLSRKVLLATK